MRKNQREGYSLSYNAQVVVDAEGSQLIVGQRVSDSATDAGQLEPDVQSIPQGLGQHTVVLGFRQLLLWGLKKVGGEWALVCLAYNVKRLHRLGAGLGLAGVG
jgi:hypothetical protein